MQMEQADKDKLARSIKASIPEGASYVLLIADGNTLEYLSNVAAEYGADMLRALSENLDEGLAQTRELPDA